MSIRRIDIVSVPVSDQDAAGAFYTDILGFRVISDNPMGPGQRWLQLGLPGAETSITLVTWFDAMPAGSLRSMVLDTEDIDSAHPTLRARGLDISDVAEAPWGRYATFSDPDGNGWLLQQAKTDT